VTLVDNSVWVALSLPPHGHHAAAREWFERQPDDASVLFFRATQQSFLRLLSTEAVMRAYALSPMTNADAWCVYDALRADRRIASPRSRRAWRRPGDPSRPATPRRPSLWMDAYLAAFAVAAGVELVTTDTAFKPFKGLPVRLLRKWAVALSRVYKRIGIGGPCLRYPLH
jgi:uncharacterized protein